MNKKVYFIGCDDSVKIGISDNPEERLKQMQTGNPSELKILKTYHSDDAEATEKALHRIFDDARIQGEWFSIYPPSLDMLFRVASISGIDNAVEWHQGERQETIDLFANLSFEIDILNAKIERLEDGCNNG